MTASCPRGYIHRKSYKKHSYRKKNGTVVSKSHVKSSCIKDRGKNPSWIERTGKLGGPGFLNKTRTEQYKILDKCVREYGYRSCLGSIMVLERSSTLRQKYGYDLKKLREYLKSNYGGTGSFKSLTGGKRSSTRRKRSSTRRKHVSTRTGTGTAVPFPYNLLNF